MTKRKPPAPTLTPWQQYLLAGLKALAAQQPADLRVRGSAEITAGGLAGVRISLRTAGIPHTEGGLILGEHEEFLLVLPPNERLPPQVLTPTAGSPAPRMCWRGTGCASTSTPPGNGTRTQAWPPS